MSKRAWIYTLLVGQIFLWTGSAFISVLYRLLRYYEPTAVTFYTEVLYYLLQAAGIALFAAVLKTKPSLAGSRGFALFAIVSTALFMAAALLCDRGWLVMSCGLLMNLGIGMLSGVYLTRLSAGIPQQSRGRVFGFAYAIGSIGTWLLSLAEGGALLKGGRALYVFSAMAAISAVLVRWLAPLTAENGQWQAGIVRPDRRLLLLAFSVPLVCSVVNSLGYSFPAADISAVFDPVFTRIFYAVGLIAAGVVSDKNRRCGAICCFTALIFPFVSLALQDEAGISAFLSVLSYVFYGFFSVYRVVLFADLAEKNDACLFLAGFGLLGGRLGDAIGTFGGMMLAGDQLLLTCAAAGAFIVCAVLFFDLFHRLYTPHLTEKEHTEALLGAFESRYALAARQSEIFRLVVRGCSNAEISSALFLSENTVKYHMKNILRKTGCSNRTELVAAFKASASSL